MVSVGLVGLIRKMMEGNRKGCWRCRPLDTCHSVCSSLLLEALNFSSRHQRQQYSTASPAQAVKSVHPSSGHQLSGRLIVGPYLLPPNPPLNDLVHRLPD